MCLQVFVVAGGYNGRYLDSTELFYEGGESWVTGQAALPRTLGYAASVSLANSVLLIGNLYSTMYYYISQLIIDHCRRTWWGWVQQT